MRLLVSAIRGLGNPSQGPSGPLGRVFKAVCQLSELKCWILCLGPLRSRHISRLPCILWPLGTRIPSLSGSMCHPQSAPLIPWGTFMGLSAHCDLGLFLVRFAGGTSTWEPRILWVFIIFFPMDTEVLKVTDPVFQDRPHFAASTPDHSHGCTKGEPDPNAPARNPIRRCSGPHRASSALTSRGSFSGASERGVRFPWSGKTRWATQRPLRGPVFPDAP